MFLGRAVPGKFTMLWWTVIYPRIYEQLKMSLKNKLDTNLGGEGRMGESGKSWERGEHD